MAFHKSFDVAIWIPISTFGFLCVLLIAAAIIVLSYQIHNEPLALNLTKTDKICSILALLCFGIAILSDNLYVALLKYPSDDESVSVFEENLYTICNAFWALGYVFTYSLFWNRMRACFEGSMFEISRASTTLFCICVSIYLLAQLTISGCWIPVTTEDITWEDFTAYYYPLLWGRFILDMFTNALIVILFSSKLYKLILFSSAATQQSSSSQSSYHLWAKKRIRSISGVGLQGLGDIDSETGSPTEIDSTSNTTQNRTPKLSISTPSGVITIDDADQMVTEMTSGANSDLFHLLIKQFVLSMIAICSTQLFTISEIVISQGIRHAEITNHFDFYYAAYIPYHLCRSIDAVVSTVYILLSFHFNSKYYRKTCGFCQDNCVNCWTKVVRSRMTPGVKSNRSTQIVEGDSDTRQL